MTRIETLILSNLIVENDIANGHEYFEFKFKNDLVIEVEIGYSTYSLATVQDYPDCIKGAKNGDLLITISFANKTKGILDFDMTGSGDSFRIISAVLDISKKKVKKFSPEWIYFDADIITIDSKNEEEIKTGRASLYKALAKRYSRELGYQLSIVDSGETFDFILKKENRE
jgi:hypothetical protein